MHTQLFGGKRYQVFVSSTFKDLIRERQFVIQTLQMVNCFPIAMEHFPASYERQWEFIQPLIESSDFFICLIGGKYGSCDENGVSYTQREFEHAVAHKIPILVLYHDDLDAIPASKTESSDEGKEKLRQFRDYAMRDHLCKGWTVAEQLQGIVGLSLIEVGQKCDRPGWRRTDEKSTEMIRLELAYEKLLNERTELARSEERAPIMSFSDFDEAKPSILDAWNSEAELCSRSGEPLKIRMLGVCLHKSFGPLKAFISQLTIPVRVEVRMATLNRNSPCYQMLDARWKNLYEVFDHDLKELISKLELENSAANVSLKLALYNHMPNWHGVLVNYRHLFLGHCLWNEDGAFTAGQNPYDQYLKERSPTHDRKIRQYVLWFDYCRKSDGRQKSQQLLFDSLRRNKCAD